MLRDVRIRAGLGLRELARRAQVSPSYLSRVERGRQRPSWELVTRLSRHLSCPVEALARSAGLVPRHVVESASQAWLRGGNE